MERYVTLVLTLLLLLREYIFCKYQRLLNQIARAMETLVCAVHQVKHLTISPDVLAQRRK